MVNCGDHCPRTRWRCRTRWSVEVLSPSTQSTDTGASWRTLRVPSMRHFLLLRAGRPQVIHHRRSDDATRIERGCSRTAPIRLAPPGFAVASAEFYPED